MTRSGADAVSNRSKGASLYGLCALPKQVSHREGAKTASQAGRAMGKGTKGAGGWSEEEKIRLHKRVTW